MKRYKGVTNELARQAIERALELRGVTTEVVEAYAKAVVASGILNRPDDCDPHDALAHFDTAMEQVIAFFIYYNERED